MLVDKIRHELEKTGWEGVWHSSEVGGCQRALLARALGYEPLRGRASVLEEGKLHERDIVHRLRASGITVLDALEDQKEYILRWKGTDCPLVCHPDGIVVLDSGEYLLEIKSMGSFSWRKGRIQSFPLHYAQVQVGLHVTGLESAFYIVKNRDTGALREEIVRADPDYLVWLIEEHFFPVVHAYTMGCTSPQELPCHPDENVRAFCAYRYLCQDGEKLTQVDTTELSQAVALWRTGKAMEREAESYINEAREAFRQFLIKNGITKAIADGLSIQIVTSERETVDHEALRLYLPEELLGRVLKKTSVESLRVTES